MDKWIPPSHYHDSLPLYPSLVPKITSPMSPRNTILTKSYFSLLAFFLVLIFVSNIFLINFVLRTFFNFVFKIKVVNNIDKKNDVNSSI